SAPRKASFAHAPSWYSPWTVSPRIEIVTTSTTMSHDRTYAAWRAGRSAGVETPRRIGTTRSRASTVDATALTSFEQGPSASRTYGGSGAGRGVGRPVSRRTNG